MNRIQQTISNFFAPLSTAQRVLFGLLSTGLLAIMVLLFYWAFRPSYATLYGSLKPEVAQSMVEQLKKDGIDYKLEDDGRAILVPSDKVYTLRLQFASDGIASGTDYKGYELFDENTLGMTDFMQKVNRKRALEGELARTINSLKQVKSSRIHLVLPERSPFKKNEVKPSASVILNLKQGMPLDHEQIEGIGRFIAGSVEDLTTDNVIILDQNGNRISDDVLADKSFASSSAQMKIRQSTEQYLMQKGQTMLDRVLGPGNSIIRISTEHNFDKVTRESDLIDPESRIIISEEKRKQLQNNQTGTPVRVDKFTPANQRNQTITTDRRNNESTIEVKNYEVNKTREQVEKTVGDIKRISASILLNFKKENSTGTNGEVSVVSKPYTQQEIQEIRTVMVNALGIKEDRGDKLAITQIKFHDPALDAAPQSINPFSTWEIIRYTILALALGFLGFLVYQFTKKFNPDQIPVRANISTEPRLESHKNDSSFNDEKLLGESVDDDIYKNKLSPEAQKKLIEQSTSLTDKINEFINTNSKEAASVVRSMMIQEYEKSS